MSADLEKPVSDVMTRDVATVTTTTSVQDAVQVMLERGVLGVAVVDGSGAAVGVFSMTDALWATRSEERDEADDSFYDAAVLLRLVKNPEPPEASELPVRQLMNKKLVSVGEESSVREAAALMAKRRIHRVLVLGEKKKLLGIVSALDVCRYVSS